MRGHFVTPNYFPTLGVRPAIGPGLPAVRTDDAPGAELAVVIATPSARRQEPTRR